jgi:Domain of unknown function (DUF1830)
MAQVFDPLPTDRSDRFLCCYVNATSQIQVVRVTNVAEWYFERVVFPGQHLIFEAFAQAQLEIHTGMMASSILSDTIPCSELKVVPPGEMVSISALSRADPAGRTLEPFGAAALESKPLDLERRGSNALSAAGGKGRV